MKPLSFLFAVHSHQPVGNFDSVFTRAFEQCYRPLIETLDRHPGVRATLHFSGVLLDWFEDRQPNLLDQLGDLVARGQIELLGGGLYEPILISIPEADALGQIEAMSERLERRFGVRPKGAWLAERVWYPTLPTLLARAGIRFTLLDDHPFLAAGVPPERLRGHFLTERLGASVEVFPILKELRYAIPFRPVEEVLELFKGWSEQAPPTSVTYGDDGEKFGLWPGTQDWVYRTGWLDRFFQLLEDNASWIWMPGFTRFLEENPCTGRVYLPEASYEEMGEWALPPAAALELWRLKEDLAREGKIEQARPFLRGGWWENFLAKYPESNDLQKKMLRTSELVRRASERAAPEDREILHRELYLAQCNCAYWHGLFGGIYLNYLRHAVHEHLSRARLGAERILGLPEPRVERGDLDIDGDEELAVETPELSVVLDPAEGGSVVDLTYKPRAYSLTNVLTRREEAYHSRLRAAVAASADGRPSSPHDTLRLKEQGLERFLAYDPYTRRSFLDHIFGFDATLDGYMFTQYTEFGDFLGSRFSVAEVSDAASDPLVVRMERKGTYWMGRRPVPLQLIKTFRFVTGRASLECEVVLRSSSDEELPLRYGMELNLTLLAGNQPDRFYEIPGRPLKPAHLASVGEAEAIPEVDLVDRWAGFRVRLVPDPPATLWRFPLETISQSEDGVERTYQGSSLLFSWMRDLPPAGEIRSRLTLTLEPLS